jgi:hypothetical protein
MVQRCSGLAEVETHQCRNQYEKEEAKRIVKRGSKGSRQVEDMQDLRAARIG